MKKFLSVVLILTFPVLISISHANGDAPEGIDPVLFKKADEAFEKNEKLFEFLIEPFKTAFTVVEEKDTVAVKRIVKVKSLEDGKLVEKEIERDVIELTPVLKRAKPGQIVAVQLSGGWPCGPCIGDDKVLFSEAELRFWKDNESKVTLKSIISGYKEGKVAENLEEIAKLEPELFEALKKQGLDPNDPKTSDAIIAAFEKQAEIRRKWKERFAAQNKVSGLPSYLVYLDGILIGRFDGSVRGIFASKDNKRPAELFLAGLEKMKQDYLDKQKAAAKEALLAKAGEKPLEPSPSESGSAMDGSK